MDRSKHILIGLLLVTIIVLGVGSWFSYSTISEQKRSIEQLTQEKQALESELVEKTSKTIIVYDPQTGKKISEETSDTYTKKKEKQTSDKTTKNKEENSSKIVTAARTNHILGSYGRSTDGSSEGGLSYVKSFGALDVGAGVESRLDFKQAEAKVYVGVNF